MGALVNKKVVIYCYGREGFYNGNEELAIAMNLTHAKFGPISKAKKYENEEEAMKDMIDYPGGGVLKRVFTIGAFELRTIITPL